MDYLRFIKESNLPLYRLPKKSYILTKTLSSAMHESKSPFSVFDCSLAFIMLCIWGSNYAIAKLGLQYVPPFAFMALRFTLTAAMLLPFISFSTQNIKEVFVYSVLIGLVHFGGIFSALSIADAATVIIISQISVPLSLLLATLLLNEKMRWPQIVGVMIAISGVIIFTGNPHFDGGIKSVIFILIGAAAWSIGTIWMKKKLFISYIMINFWMSVFSVPMLLIASWSLGENTTSSILDITPLAGLTVFFQALFVVIIGYGIWNHLIQKYDVKNVAPLTLLVPFSGLFFAWIILGEKLSLIDVVGGGLTLLGVGFIVLPQALFTNQKVFNSAIKRK